MTHVFRSRRRRSRRIPAQLVRTLLSRISRPPRPRGRRRCTGQTRPMRHCLPRPTNRNANHRQLRHLLPLTRGQPPCPKRVSASTQRLLPALANPAEQPTSRPRFSSRRASMRPPSAPTASPPRLPISRPGALRAVRPQLAKRLPRTRRTLKPSRRKIERHGLPRSPMAPERRPREAPTPTESRPPPRTIRTTRPCQHRAKPQPQRMSRARIRRPRPRRTPTSAR